MPTWPSISLRPSLSPSLRLHTQRRQSKWQSMTLGLASVSGRPPPAASEELRGLAQDLSALGSILFSWSFIPATWSLNFKLLELSVPNILLPPRFISPFDFLFLEGHDLSCLNSIHSPKFCSTGTRAVGLPSLPSSLHEEALYPNRALIFFHLVLQCPPLLNAKRLEPLA